MTLRRLHRVMAMVLGVFLILHIGNHLTIVAGTAVHLRTMAALRVVYGYLPVELLLMALFATQAAVGLVMVRRRGKPRNYWGWAQSASGVVLSVFLLVHMGAVLNMRVVAAEVATNVYWAAATLHGSYAWFFAPYYSAGLIALSVHLACVLRRFYWPVRAFIVCTILLSVVIVAGFAGGYETFDFPPVYREMISH